MFTEFDTESHLCFVSVSYVGSVKRHLLNSKKNIFYFPFTAAICGRIGESFSRVATATEWLMLKAAYRAI